MNGKPRARYPKQQHAFRGLLRCGRCGCTITAERKKGKYTYYRCTGFYGRCGNSYVREELLADLLGEVVKRTEIPAEIAEWIAEGIRDADSVMEQTRKASLNQLTQRRRGVQAKLDRGYEDYLERRISEGFWRRKAEDWESELRAVDAELSGLARPTPTYAATGEKILELAKSAYSLYSQQ